RRRPGLPQGARLHVPRVGARRRLLPRGAAPRGALRAARHARGRPPDGQAARADQRPGRAERHARVADRRPPGARGLRHVRRGLRRPPRPAPHPHARGLRGVPPAARLPDRRRADPMHRARGAGHRLHAGHQRRRPREAGDHRRAVMATTGERRTAAVDVSSIHAVSPSDVYGTHDELLTLNMGPHHPATHGVLRLLTTLEGEVVRDAKPIIGYVHTGIEKTCEDKSYWKVVPVVERMDYLAYYFNAMAFCGAVETL